MKIKKVNTEMIMTKFEQAFEKHVNNEFPPKYVFYSDVEGNVGMIKLKNLNDFESSHKFIGMTINSLKHKHLLAAGNLPILKRI